MNEDQQVSALEKAVLADPALMAVIREAKGASEWLKPGEVAAMFRVTSRTVIRWSQEGLLGSIRTPGGHRRYRREDVERFRNAIPDNSPKS